MTTGILNWADMRSAINLNTGFFETNRYTLNEQMYITSGNWDDAGLSVGNLQYNFGTANRASELFNHMINNHNTLVRDIFGVDYQEFETVNVTYTREQKVVWGGEITDWNYQGGRALLDPWKSAIGNLLLTPECMDKYFQMMDAYYIPDALDLFKQLPCTSRASLASLFDININRGRYYPCNTLVVDFDQIQANVNLSDEEKEAQMIYQINVRGNDPTNAMDASAPSFEQRRMCMANQTGTYYGSLYNPEPQFDINQEPAIPEKSDLLQPTVKLGGIDVDNIYFGDAPIKSIYLGVDLAGLVPKPYTTDKIPNTQFRTNSNSYAGFEDGAVTLEKGQKLWIDVQNFVACRTYYTIDGSIPTEDSNLYYEYLTFENSCTLKVLNVSLSGVAEPIRTLEITVPAFAGWRYVRFVGHGDQTGVTTRLVEIQALEGATNRLLNKLPLAGYTAPNGGSIGVATDGAVVHSAGYPLWWLGEGIPELIYDMGAPYMIDTLKVVGYSPAIDPRQTQFKVYVSTDNSDWELIADMSANTTPQTVDGWTFTL